LRRFILYLGAFVAYSQLVSAGLTAVYRFSPSELAFVDGGSPGVFDALMLLQPPDRIGTINDLQANGLTVHCTPLDYAAWTIIAPVLGSAGLFLAYIARSHSALAKLLLVMASGVGVVAAFMIKFHEFRSGSLGWAVGSMTATGGALAQPVHPIYGYAEFLGSLVFPVIAYVAITLGVVVTTCREFLTLSRKAGRDRHSSL